MTSQETLVQAGNTLPLAFAEIKRLGFQIVYVKSINMLRAFNHNKAFLADDPLSLLGLIKLSELRGMKPQSNDNEIAEWLDFDKELFN
jgi:hypothetical protein